MDLYVYMLEKRVFFDNPDMGYDRVLRRCANDAKFASGGLLVDALFRFGLHMRDPENVVRDAYLEALESEITCVNIDGASSQLAARPRIHSEYDREDQDNEPKVIVFVKEKGAPARTMTMSAKPLSSRPGEVRPRGQGQ